MSEDKVMCFLLLLYFTFIFIGNFCYSVWILFADCGVDRTNFIWILGLFNCILVLALTVYLYHTYTNTLQYIM